MSMCYYVKAELKYSDKKEVERLLRQYIVDQSDQVDFNLDYYREKGVYMKSLDDLMKIIITDRGFTKDGDVYTSNFNASYGWKSVMINMFKFITPSLLDDSRMLIYPDYGVDELVVQNGECVQIQKKEPVMLILEDILPLICDSENVEIRSAINEDRVLAVYDGKHITNSLSKKEVLRIGVSEERANYLAIYVDDDM